MMNKKYRSGCRLHQPVVNLFTRYSDSTTSISTRMRKAVMNTTNTTTTTYLVTGDIGGTNSRMSLYATSTNGKKEQDSDLSEQLFALTYRNETCLPSNVRQDPDAFCKYIIRPFLEKCCEEGVIQNVNHCQIIACLAIAGVVSNNRVNLTNLDGLLIDGNRIASDQSCPLVKSIVQCRIINDFVAQGYGCLTLRRHEVRQIYGPASANVEALPVGVKACVGAGTGLGECFLTPDDHGKYHCFPSEGGHVEFSARNDLEMKLFRYLSAKFASKHRISVERVVSGIGLANVYEFLATEYPDRIVQHVHEEFEKAGDEKGRVVAVNASTPDSLCAQAMSIMMSAYGCEVGSAAIKWLPLGGLFVTGGLTPKNIDHIVGPETEFTCSYKNKGRVSPVLEKIPTFAVMVEDLGVRGAHKAALMAYEEMCIDTSNSSATQQGFLGFDRETWTAIASMIVSTSLAFYVGTKVRPSRS